MKKYLLIDGHNYLYRSYYGVPATARTKIDMIQVNAVYGFFSDLRKIYNKIEPDGLKVIFDSETGINIKKKNNNNYKANRKYEDKEIFNQLRIIKKILQLLEIDYIEDSLYEADDVIATYAKQFSIKNKIVYISSNDFDFIQILDERTKICRFEKGNIVIYDNKKTIDKFGINTDQYLDYLALNGDKSDNIKGVKGIGKVTAKKIISEYSSIENLFENFNDLSIQNKRLLHDQESYLKNIKAFLKIRNDLPIEISFDLNFNKKLLLMKSNYLLSKLGIN